MTNNEECDEYCGCYADPDTHETEQDDPDMPTDPIQLDYCLHGWKD